MYINEKCHNEWWIYEICSFIYMRQDQRWEREQ